ALMPNSHVLHGDAVAVDARAPATDARGADDTHAIGRRHADAVGWLVGRLRRWFHSSILPWNQAPQQRQAERARKCIAFYVFPPSRLKDLICPQSIPNFFRYAESRWVSFLLLFCCVDLSNKDRPA